MPSKTPKPAPRAPRAAPPSRPAPVLAPKGTPSLLTRLAGK